MQQAYDRIEKTLRSFDAKRRLKLSLARLMGLLTLLIVLLLAGSAVKYIAGQHPWLPFLYSVSSISVIGAALFAVAYALMRKWPLDRTAITLQENIPLLGDDLINSVQIYKQFRPHVKTEGISERLASALIESTARRLDQVDLGPPVKKAAPCPNLKALLILLSTAVVVSIFAPSHISYSLNLILHPRLSSQYAQVGMEVSPGNASVLKGEQIEIAARYSRPLETDTWLYVGPEGKQTRHRMTPQGEGQYKFNMEEVREPIYYSVRSKLARSDIYLLSVVEPPLVEKLQIKLIPPSYTGLEARTREDNGNISAYPGTEALFDITSAGEISKAALRFQGGESLPLKQRDGVWQGQAVLLSRQRYHIDLKDNKGFSNQNPIDYQIEIIPDQSPKIEIVSPAQDLEMNEGEELPITYVGKDDFDVSEVHLVYAINSGEKSRIKIHGGTEDRSVVSGQYIWQLIGEEFSHGSLVSYYLEALDNDTISGPHTGVSKTYTVKIRGREEEHQRILDRITGIIEDLLWLLADQLEEQDAISGALSSSGTHPGTEFFTRAVDKKQEFKERLLAVIDEVLSTVEGMTMDPLSSYNTYFDLDALLKNLQYLAHTTIENSKIALERMPAENSPEKKKELLALEERLTRGFEQAVLLAEGAGKESTTADLANISSEMLKEQGDLMDLLKQFMETGDMAAMEKFMGQMEQLQDMLTRFMEKMMELVQAPPEEFLNSESAESLDMGELQELMKQIQEAVANGDMEKAMELAKSFMEALARVMAMLQEMSSLSAGRFEQFQETTTTLVDELKKIIDEQKKILTLTEAIHRDMTGRVHQLQTKRREELNRSIRTHLDQAFMALERRLSDKMRRAEVKQEDYRGYSLLKQRMKKLVEQLIRGDSTDFREAMQGFIRELEKTARKLYSYVPGEPGARRGETVFRSHLADMKKWFQELQSLVPGPQHITSGEGLKLEELSLKEQGLGEDTERLAEFIQRLSYLLPMLLPEIADNLWEAGDNMDQSASRLNNRDTVAALPTEREALYLLKKALDQLQEAVNRLSASASMSGFPMPFFLGQGRPSLMPFGLMPGTGYQQGGRFGQTLRPFKIPSPEDYKVPGLLREEVLKALKEGYPSEFKEEIKQYFKSLSK